MCRFNHGFMDAFINQFSITTDIKNNDYIICGNFQQILMLTSSFFLAKSNKICLT